MRIIGGEFRSRRLTAPRGDNTRPTSDRLRETLFNVLGPRLVAGTRFADLYAGSGAVGLEALSRGAGFCCFVERAPAAVAAVRGNLATLAIAPSRFTLLAQPVQRALGEFALKTNPFHLLFLDPPYEAAAEYTATLHLLSEHAATLVAPEGLVIAEHARRTPMLEQIGALTRTRLLEQGDAALSFYAVRPNNPKTHN